MRRIQSVRYAPAAAWLLPWLRANRGYLGAPGLWVSDRWPNEDDDPPSEWVAVIDGGGEDTGRVTQTRDFTVNIAAATRRRVDDLAARVAALIRVSPYDPDIPVARVDFMTGPHQIADDAYENLRSLTVTVTTVGTVDTIEIGEAHGS